MANQIWDYSSSSSSSIFSLSSCLLLWFWYARRDPNNLLHWWHVLRIGRGHYYGYWTRRSSYYSYDTIRPSHYPVKPDSHTFQTEVSPSYHHTIVHFSSPIIRMDENLRFVHSNLMGSQLLMSRISILTLEASETEKIINDNPNYEINVYLQRPPGDHQI